MTQLELSDGLIERALRSRAATGADELLVRSILQAAGDVRQLRRPVLGLRGTGVGIGLQRTRWALLAAAALVVAIAALLLAGGGHNPVSIPSSFSPSPAPTAGLSPLPSSAATGRLVYIHDGNVVMLQVDTGIQYVIAHVNGAFDPHWSPDGTAVAFRAGGGSVVGQDSGLAVRVSIDGSNELRRPLGTHVVHDAWSPDTLRLTQEVQGTAPADVEVEQVLVNRFTLLKFLAADETLDVDAPTVWSPDGTRFAVVACAPVAACATPGNGSRYTIYDVPIDGTPATVVFSEDRGAAKGYPEVMSWTPDGRDVAFADVRLGCPIGLDCVPIEWTAFTVPAAGGPPSPILADDLTARTLRWSPDGTRVAFTSNRGADGSDRIWISDSAFGNLITIHEGTDPVWSPDGRWLAYAEGGGAALYIQPADGSSPGQLLSATSSGYDWWQPGASAGGVGTTAAP